MTEAEVVFGIGGVDGIKPSLQPAEVDLEVVETVAQAGREEDLIPLQVRSVVLAQFDVEGVRFVGSATPQHQGAKLVLDPKPPVKDSLIVFFDSLVEGLVEQLAAYDVVGVTATHYQLVPSLILCQRLARLGRNRPKIILGGYLSSPELAKVLLDHHPELDVVVFGEAEGAWPSAVGTAMRGERQVLRGSGHGFGDYKVDHRPLLDRVAEVPWLAKRFQVSLEFSRGCYWDKCDFCNFNVSYDSRLKQINPGILLDQMDQVHASHGQRRFQLLDTAVPRRFSRYLREHEIVRDYDLFCEIRPDFTYDQLADLARLGRLRAQIGIESLVDSHLRAMDKNATLAGNIRVLHDCAALGIPVTWGVFVAHPKETTAELELMLARMQAWTHLLPPKYVTHCEIRAGSPLWNERSDYGFRAHMPFRVFDRVLPPLEEASEFVPAASYTPGTTRERKVIIEKIEAAATRWQRLYSDGAQLEVTADGRCVVDTRGANALTIELSANESAVLAALRLAPKTNSQIQAVADIPCNELEAALDRLSESDLVVLCDGERGAERAYCSLVSPHRQIAPQSVEVVGIAR